MKTYSIVFFALLVISGISDINCGENHQCFHSFHACSLNFECCSNDCQDLNSTHSICIDIESVADIHKDVYNLCSPAVTTNGTESDDFFEEFGFNAAHAVVPAGSQVLVEYEGHYVTVTINGKRPSGNLTFELSEETANALNISGVVPCQIMWGQMDSTVIYHLAANFAKPFAFFGLLVLIVGVYTAVPSS